MNTIRTALGQLQQDSDSTEAWQALEAGVEKHAARQLDQIRGLFAAARASHSERHEWWALARILALEIAVTPSSDTLTDLWREYGIVQLHRLYDEGEAANAFAIVLEAHPKDKEVKAWLNDSDDRRAHWEERAAQYLSEAEGASDDVYKSSMLMRVAEMELRFGGADVDVEVIEKRLRNACGLDPENLSAYEMFEYLCRRSEDWQKLAELLEKLLVKATGPQIRTLFSHKLARLCLYRLLNRERAAAAYQQLLESDPASAEASSFLAEYHSEQGAWQELVRVYERRLMGEESDSPDRLGDMLQIAMLYSRKLNQAADAEPWFERVRKLDPGNAAVLDFFREHLKNIGDNTRLVAVLQGAERVLPEGAQKKAVLRELENQQDSQKGAQHSIESYKTQLRQDPGNTEIRAKLKELYREAGSYNALVELLRQQIERTAPDDQVQRLSVLQEVAEVYRRHLPGDPALATVLTQIVTLDPQDAAVLRELCAAYERLARWRDLLTYQQKLAEVTPDIPEKVELLRAVARRWLEQFSNVQNATSAYEALIAADATDADAREQLQELYTKRRAWQPLYDLLATQTRGDLPAAERVHVLRQLAQLCADRLARPQDAIAYYREIVELNPEQSDLEALERQAERAKDWATLAHALERRIDTTVGDEAQVALLQKLAIVQSDHLGDGDAALKSWRRVTGLQPSNARALRFVREAYLSNQNFDEIEQLYAEQNDFDGLAEVLGQAAEKSEDTKIKIDLSYRAARVYSDNLGQPLRAVRSYERIIAANPHDAQAAALLIPIYEQDEKWARLPALYEILISATEDPAQKLAHLNKGVSIMAAHLGDRMGGLMYARRAFETMPDDPDVMMQFEKSAGAAGKWDSFADALANRLTQLRQEPGAIAENSSDQRGQGKRKKQKDKKERSVQSAPNSAHERAVTIRLAHVCDAYMQASDRAIELLKGLMETDPSDFEVAGSLEVILRREGKRDDLRWLLDRKVEQTEIDGEKAQLLADWATLEEDVFKDSVQAAALFRRLLEISPANVTALRSLSRLLLANAEFAAAVEILERSAGSLNGLDRAEVEVQLGQLYFDQLSNPEKALNHAVGALQYGSHDTRAIALMERLVQVEGTRERAAQVLAAEYAEVGDARHEVEALQAMLSAAKDPDERFTLLTRLAGIQEHKLDSVNASFDTMLRTVREFPERLEVWDQAQDLASRAERAGELAEALRETLTRVQGTELELDICERAAQLHQEKLGDPSGAVPYLERILKRDPANSGAFAQLKHVLTAEERWGELAELYDLVIAHEQSTVVQIELLLEVAMLCEEITDDIESAVRYYERIQSVDPLNESACKALDRLYSRLGKNTELASLLERRIPDAGESEQGQLMNRLAALLIEKLHRPAEAVAHLEAVLEADPNDVAACELSERLLQIGSFRQQAINILERVYESRDDARNLARILDVQLTVLEEQGAAKAKNDSEESARYKEALRRVAVLKDSRLHDDKGAFAVLARFVPLEPLDFDARAALVQIAVRLSNYSELVDVFEQAEAAIESPEAKAEILLAAAALCAEHLHASPRAEGLYSRVIALREDAPDLAIQAMRALNRIFSQVDRIAELAEILRMQIDLEDVQAAKSELQAQLANLFETRLSKVDQAIAVWIERLEADPVDLEALSALDRLYETTGRWLELVPILRQRQEQAVDASERRTLLVRLAQVLADKLGAVDDAIAAWTTLIDSFGNEREARVALEQLYRSAKRWEDLSESYVAHAEVAASDAERIELWRMLGELRAAELADPAAALDAFREGLALDAKHQTLRVALHELLRTEDAQVRRDTAAVLRALYEAENDSVRLLSVLEVQVEASDDPIDKVEVLQLAVKVAEKEVGDVHRALVLAQRAVREGAGHVDLKSWLDDLNRLSAATGERAAQVALLREVVDRIFDGDLKYDVTLQVGLLARDELGQIELARDYFEQATGQDPTRPEPLLALEAIYQQQQNWSEVLRVLARRIEISADPAERLQLLFQKARLLAKELSEPLQAIEAYEAIVAEKLDHVALEALESLYRSQERYADLVTLLERELDANPAREAEYRVKMATVLADNLLEPLRALDEVEAALKASPHFPQAAAFLTRVLQTVDADPEYRGRAAELVEPIYLATADYEQVLKVLAIRLESLTDQLERRKVLLRIAKLYEEQKEDFHSALETLAKLYVEDISDESVSLELERLAKVANAKPRLAEIYAAALGESEIADSAAAQLARRTGELLEEQGDQQRALGFLERALAFTPEDSELFTLIDKILERLGRHSDRVELYRQVLDHSYEPRERLRLQHAIAALQRNQLHDLPNAIEAYVQALDIDDRDPVALDALGDLYRETEQYGDLAEHYLRRAELAETPEAQAEQRLLLARICRKRLSDTGRAIDQLEEITRIIPQHAGAIADLESLRDAGEHRERVIDILRPIYEESDSWQRLISLNEDRLSLTDNDGDRIAVLKDNANLWENRGQAPERARVVLGKALELDPNDAEVRGNYERLVEQTRAWAELAERYERLLEVPDLIDRAELIAVLVKAYDQHLQDMRSALRASQKLLELDPSQLDLVEKALQFALLLGDWSGVVQLLEVKVDLQLDDGARAAVWHEIAEIQRDMMENTAAAVEAGERTFDVEPGNVRWLDFLIELHLKHNEPARLVELCQQRLDVTAPNDSSQRYEMLLIMAEAYLNRLTDPINAAETLELALAEKPGDAAALEQLASLHRSQEAWPEYLQVLARLAEGAVDENEKARFLKQTAALLASEMNEPEQALSVYRRVLQLCSSDTESVGAVFSIGQQHESLRSEVAALLVPLLADSQQVVGADPTVAAEQAEKLVAALELRLSVESEASARVTTLQEVAQVKEARLSDAAGALKCLLSAVKEVPENGQLHQEIERLCELTRRWGEYAELLEDRAGNTLNSEDGRELWLRLGRICEEKLRDTKRGIAAYSRAIEHSGDQPETLAALDRLYSDAGDAKALSDILQRRLAFEARSAERAELHIRLARLYRGEFEDPTSALASLKQSLECNPQQPGILEELEQVALTRELFNDASELLEAVYRSSAQTDRLASLYERRVSFAESLSERSQLRRRLATVLDQELGDAARAQQVLHEGLKEDPTDAEFLADIQGVLTKTSDYQGAALALEQAVKANKELQPRVARDLCLRAARWYRDQAQNASAALAALFHALEYDDSSDEVLQEIEALQRSARDNSGLLSTLRQRARLQSDAAERESLYRQLVELAQAEEPAAADAALREMLDNDSANPWALQTLQQRCEAAQEYKEAFRLLERRIEVETDQVAAAALMHHAAQIARDKLRKAQLSIDLYSKLFDADVSDTLAARSLRELFVEEEQWAELRALLQRLVDASSDPQVRVTLLLELAELCRSALKDTQAASASLRGILEVDPSHAEAFAQLMAIYKKDGQVQLQAELLIQQIEAAEGRSNQDAAQQLRLELAALQEDGLNSRADAIATLEAVLTREPSQRVALQSLIRLLGLEKRTHDVVTRLAQLVEISPQAEALLLISELASAQRVVSDINGEISTLERGLVLDAASEVFRKELLAAYEKAERWEPLADLIASNAEGAATNAEKVSLLRRSAKVHLEKRSDPAKAAAVLARASEITPNDRELLLELCDAYTKSGRADDSVKVLEQIVESFAGRRSKELVDVHRRLAVAYHSSSRSEQAMVELEKAFRIEPGNIVVLKELGLLSFELGDMKKAQQMFRALLLQKFEADTPISKAEVFFHLAEIHERLGEKPKALQMAERAVQTDATFAAAHQLVQRLKA